MLGDVASREGTGAATHPRRESLVPPPSTWRSDEYSWGLMLAGSAGASPAPDSTALGASDSSRITAGRLYVANQDAATVSVVDVGTLRVVHTVDLQALGFPANSKPHHTAVEPDGSHWYVSLIAAGKVLKFTRENELVGQADFETPGMLALHPREDLLFVGRSMAAVNPPQRVGVVNRTDMEIDEVDVFFPRPHAIAVHPNGRYVYTASLGVNQIAGIDLESDEIELTTVDGPTHVMVQFAISPDGRWLVATGQITGTLLVFDLSNASKPRHVRTIEVNPHPWHPTFSPDGRFVYFGNQATNTVTMIDAQRWEVAQVIEGHGLAEPHGIAVSADGRYLFVSNRNLKGDYPSVDNEGTVVVIDTASRTIEKVIEVGPYAAGMSLGR